MAITIAEIEAGTAATTKADKLRRWLIAVEQYYDGRILPFDVEEVRHPGAILDRARACATVFEDIAIAATAAARGLTLLTAGERHFEQLGVSYVSPPEHFLTTQ